MSPNENMLAGITRSEADWQALLVRWSEINSGFDHANGLARMCDELERAFKPLSPYVVRLAPAAGGRAPTLSVRCRPEAPLQVLLSGHYDTVFSANDLFQTCQLLPNGCVNGPGLADMKGGIVVMLAALTAFEAHPDAHQIGWEVLLNADEEDGSHGSRAHLTAAAGRHHLGLVFEPSPVADDIVRSRKGTGTLLVTARGRAAHSSQAKTEGRNAVVALAEFLIAAHALNREIGDIVLNVANCSGGGAVNVVPDAARAELHLRCSRVEEGERAISRLRAIAEIISGREGFGLTIEGGFNRPPMEAQDGAAPWIDALQVCARELGQTVSVRDVASASDANFFAAAGLPTIDGLGVDGDEIHSDREFYRTDSLGRRARLVALLLARLADGSLPRPTLRELSP